MAIHFDYTRLWEILKQSPLDQRLRTLTRTEVDNQPWNHGDFSRWQTALEDLDQATDRSAIESALRKLVPWRKGPFDCAGVTIDTEWRSDLKWARIAQGLAQRKINSLQNHSVLDVGCGNGYFGWQMCEAGADLVLGIDPTLLFVAQFFATRRFYDHERNWVLPMGIESMPELGVFDSVFSMGVLYHRRSPIEHLTTLRRMLKPDGQLIIETLVIENDQPIALTPAGRYAKMRNVWFIPTPDVLEFWLRRSRFSFVQLVDLSTTSNAEQRATEWMPFESLDDFLDPADKSRTIEGYPAPKRALYVATAD